jgi:hypothetical protein
MEMIVQRLLEVSKLNASDAHQNQQKENQQKENPDSNEEKEKEKEQNKKKKNKKNGIDREIQDAIDNWKQKLEIVIDASLLRREEKEEENDSIFSEQQMSNLIDAESRILVLAKERILDHFVPLWGDHQQDERQQNNHFFQFSNHRLGVDNSNNSTRHSSARGSSRLGVQSQVASEIQHNEKYSIPSATPN